MALRKQVNADCLVPGIDLYENKFSSRISHLFTGGLFSLLVEKYRDRSSFGPGHTCSFVKFVASLLLAVCFRFRLSWLAREAATEFFGDAF